MHRGWRRVRFGFVLAFLICALGALPLSAHAADRIKPKISSVTNTTIHPAGIAKKITATVKDNKKVKTVVLKYRVMPGKTFKSVTMKKSGGKYSASIPASKLNGQPVQYYVQATDTSRNTAKAPSKAPKSLYKVTPCTNITVTPARVLFNDAQAQQYVAKATAKTGAVLSIKPVWSASAGIGTITSGGLYTSNATNNGYVYAKLGGLTGSARVFARITGVLPASTTWTAANGPYLVNDLEIPAGRTLTIEAGTVVKFLTSNSKISVGGTLNVNGISASKVTFTSVKDDTAGGDTNLDGTAAAPAPADWDEIAVTSGGRATFNWADVRYGGSAWSGNDYAALEAYSDSHLIVKNCTVSANKFGLSADRAATLEISGTDFARNTGGAAWLYSPPDDTVLDGNTFTGPAAMPSKYAGIHLEGNITGSLTLPAEGVYTVEQIYIPAGAALTFKPGTVVKFLSAIAPSLIEVRGTLNAVGVARNGATPAVTCVFTSIKDDTIGGDTGGDGTASTPLPGNWNSIIVASGGTATMHNSLVSYGGSGGVTGPDAAYYGAVQCASDGTLNGQFCDFVNNKVAVSGADQSSPTEAFPNVVNVDVRNCYWGSASGPTYGGHTGGDWVGFFKYDIDSDAVEEVVVNEWITPFSPTSLR
jgi:hypothetical protein